MYWFLNAKGEVLYVGKAKNLKKRVVNYTQTKKLINRIREMTAEAVKLKYQVLESELEALLVEAELIGLYQPRYNILLKDDKSALYVWITAEIFPRVLTIRKKEFISAQPSGTILGPFQSSYKLNEVLKIIRPIFPWCNQTRKLENSKVVPINKACFYYHLDLCPGACTGGISVADYQNTINNLKLFLRGKKKEVLVNLKKQLKEYVKKQAFEKAGQARDSIQLIEAVTSQKYKLNPDTTLPQLTTDNENKIRHLQKILADYLKLPKTYPLHRIEAYDVSNIQGTNPAVAMVTFIDGQPAKAEYRLFNIRTLQTPNDVGMLKEALQRRQNHAEWGRPDLIIIDGGKGQLRNSLSVWTWNNPVISIAKNPDRLVIPILDSAPDKMQYHLLKLPATNPALILAQQLRDEAHRFSKKQHSRRRLKNMFK